MWDDLEQRRKGERLRRKRNIGSPRRGTFSRLGLKNRVNLRTRPRARYKETRICMRFFRNLPHEDENSFNTGTSVESFCAIYDGPPALYIFINYNPLLITCGEQNSTLITSSWKVTEIVSQRMWKLKMLSIYIYRATNIFPQYTIRSFARVRITMDSHFSLTDKNPVDGKRTIHRDTGHFSRLTKKNVESG